VDKTITNSWYDIEIDPATQLPVSIRAVILTGSRGGTESMGKKITGGEHVAFHFTYKLSEFGKVERPVVPPDAARLLARS
jgi:hypothetical protein